MFDFWYGPAVLYERPTIRVKRLSDDEIDITRIAEPVIHPNENIVDVNYDVNIVTKVSKTVAKLSECHRMRYLFLPEIRDYLARHDMKLIFFIEWLTGREPGFDTWNVCAGAMVDAP